MFPAALIALSLCACSGADPNQEDTTGDTDAELVCGAAGSQHEGEPPAPAKDAASPDGPDLVFAVSRFYLGSQDLSGVPSSTARWDFGFNLDATLSTDDPSAPHCGCSPRDGAKARRLYDGNDGRDNGFGRDVFPILTALDAESEDLTNDLVQSGGLSWVLRLRGVGSKEAYAGLGADLYQAGPLLAEDGSPMAPKLDGSDVWPIADASVEGGDLASPKLQIADAYTVPMQDGGTLWIGRGKGALRIDLAVGVGLYAHMFLHDPLLALPLSADRTEIRAAMVAGTIDPEEAVAEVVRISGYFSYDGSDFCPPSSTLESILQQIRQAADIRTDGKIDPDAPCTAISVGIAFDAVAAKIGQVAPPEPTPEQPCWE